jgi:hypothetical protein
VLESVRIGKSRAVNRGGDEKKLLAGQFNATVQLFCNFGHKYELLLEDAFAKHFVKVGKKRPGNNNNQCGNCQKYRHGYFGFNACLATFCWTPTHTQLRCGEEWMVSLFFIRTVFIRTGAKRRVSGHYNTADLNLIKAGYYDSSWKSRSMEFKMPASSSTNRTRGMCGGILSIMKPSRWFSWRREYSKEIIMKR